MTSIPIGSVWRPYLRALAEAGLDVASVGAWVAAAELSPARRRLARGALVAATVAVAVPAVRAGRAAVVDAAEPVAPGVNSGLPYVDVGIRLPTDGGASPRRRAVLVGGVVAGVLTASVGAAAAGRQLERRWLARLARNGHPHPHRALSVRIAGLYAVIVVPSRLLAVRLGAQADRRDATSASRTEPGGHVGQNSRDLLAARREEGTAHLRDRFQRAVGEGDLPAGTDPRAAGALSDDRGQRRHRPRRAPGRGRHGSIGWPPAAS